MDTAPIVHRDIVIDGEPFALVVQTRHGGAVATTAIHRQDFGRRIGGARFVPVPEGDGPWDGLSEVGHLSSAMTEKCMAALIPADGQKSVVVAEPGVIASVERRTEILAEHIRAVVSVDSGATFGPDISVPEEIQNRLAASADLLDHVTGLSEHAGGLSIDHNGYTAEGVVQAVRTVVGGEALRGMTVSVQGFGAVGAHASRLFHDAGARLRAVSNALGVLVAENRPGLDVPALFQCYQNEGDGCLLSYSRSHPESSRLLADPDALFDVPADIFVPAARTSVLAMPEELDGIRASENPDVRDVVTFLEQTGVRVVAEGANHPLSDRAELYLEERGIRVLPDFIVNCGGLIGCWVEWEARHRLGSADVDLTAMGRAARDRVHATVTANVEELVRSGLPARVTAGEIVQRNRQRLFSPEHTSAL